MRHALNLVAAIAVAAVAQTALAQASAPASRAEVKAETRAAEKAGKLTPAGEAATPSAKPGQAST
jgi:hypothetical protein